MRELTVQQSQQVSGGIFGLITTPIGLAMGFTVGALVDGVFKANNLRTTFVWGGLEIGAGIGAAVGLAPLTAIAGISLGVQNIVENIKSITSQKAAQKS
ncbi:hypothetical protein HGT71_10250 [Rosenbergiella epipactidis]|uniref:hypothetical protein n=1 Tax=Rosenbergiella epipactidis TaxID=1544694 RepID=UPI001BDAEE77|nr:hypothetical protein [Rosenbergiella epipactidis]MBT0718631.1 hypothetical protein [Rosenbergiella epipactidis]